jgi:hypothetical protein
MLILSQSTFAGLGLSRFFLSLRTSALYPPSISQSIQGLSTSLFLLLLAETGLVLASPLAVPCRLVIGRVGLFSCFALEDADSTHEIYWTLRCIYAIDVRYGGFISQTQ